MTIMEIEKFMEETPRVSNLNHDQQFHHRTTKCVDF